MPDPFDPAEFDAPPPSDPGADYRTLLDAMRKAGAEGVAQQVAALAQTIEPDARQRAEWTAQAGVRVTALPRAIGNAPCGERGCQSVKISVVAVSLTKKKK